MLKSFKGKTRLCNVVCAFLTLCLVILQFTPFWNFGDETRSINGYVWCDSGNTEIVDWFGAQLGVEPGIGSILSTSILVLFLGVAGIVACIIKSDTGFAALLPAATSLSALYAFMFKPVFRLGSTWVIQAALSIAILVFAVMAFICGLKKNGQGEKGKAVLSQEEIDARVEAIKALGCMENKRGKAIRMENAEANFNKLLAHLTDEIPECRAAAAETLGNTSRDAAFTHIVYLLDSEKDENVIKAMRKALVSIRKNEKDC